MVIFFHTNVIADVPYFLDFKFILNESIAGKKAQNFLKNKLDKGIKNLKNTEKKILEEEKKLFNKKKSFLMRNIKIKLKNYEQKFLRYKKNEINL